MSSAPLHGLGETPDERAEGRENLLASLTNGGQPVIRRLPSEPGELELEHCWSGQELQMQSAEETLRNVAALWRGPTRLRTRLEGRARAHHLRCGRRAVPASSARS